MRYMAGNSGFVILSGWEQKSRKQGWDDTAQLALRVGRIKVALVSLPLQVQPPPLQICSCPPYFKKIDKVKCKPCQD